MKRLIILSLIALVSINMLAQEKDIIVLAKNNGYLIARPPVVATPKNKKKSICMWTDTEKNDWYEQTLELDNVPIAKDFEKMFPDVTNDQDLPYIQMPWMLTEENDETVLHCYLRMPADVIEEFWLTDVEGGILDKETGITYRARRTEPECYEKLFEIKGKKGDVLDFKIFFPKLPKTTNKIAIYGVPNWFLRGTEVNINRIRVNYNFSEFELIDDIPYDEKPQFHKPRLVVEAKNYDKDNFRTWEEYADPHLIKPVEEGTMAMWITPEATYLAIATELNWSREYFGRGGNTMLMDNTGHQYKCKGVIDYPNNTLFWVQGYSGDYFAIVLVFEPIPLTLEKITYIDPEGEPFHVRNASWEGEVRPNLNVGELRMNQRLFDYFPRKIVK